jgi:D-3-phosphoglycerate dehydrogenase
VTIPGTPLTGARGKKSTAIHQFLPVCVLSCMQSGPTAGIILGTFRATGEDGSRQDMAVWKVFVIDAPDQETYSFESRELAAVGCQLKLGHCRRADEVLAQAWDADILFDRDLSLGRDVMEALQQCKMIVQYGVGVDHIDVAAATDCGIIVANAPSYCIEEVSDHALALVLACARGLGPMDRGIRASRWKEWGWVMPWPARRLCRCTLGVIGLGRIGRAMARKCLALGMQVIAYDPYVPSNVGREPNVNLVELLEVARQADFVTLHIPLVPETHHLIDEAFLRTMKPTAFLINTSRGAVVHETALCRALEEGWIAGAGLDVLEEEPPQSNHPLLRLENVVLTPHFAAASLESTWDRRREVVEAVTALRSGFWPATVVNPEVEPRVALCHGAEAYVAPGFELVES